MAVPIFVLGLQRSGTTWIANLLAGSPAVAAVTATEHHGVHESVFFSHFATAFGPFEDADARHAFEVAFAASDYYRLSGLSRMVLSDAVAQAQDYAGVFSAVMDALAAREACSHWLEKSPHHTLLAEDLAARFPEARFVCVTRSSETLIASRLSAFGRNPPRGVRRAADIVRGCLANALYVRSLQRFANACDRALLIRYDEFAAHEDEGRRSLCRFLDLGVAPETLRSAFEANTSHRERSTRRLSMTDRLLVRIADAGGRLLPLSWLVSVERDRRRRRGANWPDWVWTQRP